jgi:hypothetical protein
METSTGQQVQSTQAARMSTLNRPLVFPILEDSWETLVQHQQKLTTQFIQSWHVWSQAQ